tara:strand:+ start:1787 stop:2980 length:1194 start_codon:yes stop_codon:yes gene_type:complete
MTERDYHIKISPEFISGDIFKVRYNAGTITGTGIVNNCCIIPAETFKIDLTGTSYVYSSMTEVLSGGTNTSNISSATTKSGTSLLTGLTIPILLTETVTDIGYYSVFDGMVLQQNTMLNFIFSGITNTKNCYFYNTSDIEFKKYLEFSTYKIDWGDGQVSAVTSTSMYHSYSNSTAYTITLSGMSPWGTNIITKTINTPFTGVTISNPKGVANFKPAGGNWSNTLLSYDYIFSGDSTCDATLNDIHLFNPITNIPFLITGYTTSSLSDLKQYGTTLYKPGVQVTGNTGMIGVFSGVSRDGMYTAYTINDIDYYDWSDGTTIFVVKSSGLTSDMLVCQPIVKNDLLMNIIDEAEVQSNIFIERGKNSALERVERLGEVDNVGDLVKYGYKFFNVINSI